MLTRICGKVLYILTEQWQCFTNKVKVRFPVFLRGPTLLQQRELACTNKVSSIRLPFLASERMANTQLYEG